MTHMIGRLLRARLEGARTSVLLLGARQVGKSTLCRSMRPELTVDLADESTYLRYAKDPGSLRRELVALRSVSHPHLVLIDEVQRLPSLLNTVQSLLDEHPRRLRFLLTGSSARKLRRGGVNLLPGRLIIEHVDPLTTLEIGKDFDLDRALQRGCLPGIYLGDVEALDVLETYSTVYLREEIRAEALVRDVGAYGRFLDVAAALSGHWLNYSKIASDAEIPKETVRRFVDILTDTLVAHRLPAFEPKRGVSRRVLQRERVLLFDVGVRNALLGRHRQPPALDEIGTLFEQWIMLQLIALNHALRKGWKLSSYRTEAGAEVDIVLETPDTIIGVEIKSGRQVRSADLTGLRSLATLVGKRRYRPILLFRGERRQFFDTGEEAVPFREGLAELAEG